jgi:hypothetical protein
MVENPDTMNNANGFGDELAASMPEPSKAAPAIMAEAAAVASGPAPSGMETTGPPPPDPGAAAANVSGLGFSLAVGFFGPEWEPQAHERTAVTSALQAYYERYGVIDLPPGWALLAALAMYALPRAQAKLRTMFPPDDEKAPPPGDPAGELPAPNPRTGAVSLAA